MKLSETPGSLAHRVRALKGRQGSPRQRGRCFRAPEKSDLLFQGFRIAHPWLPSETGTNRVSAGSGQYRSAVAPGEPHRLSSRKLIEAHQTLPRYGTDRWRDRIITGPDFVPAVRKSGV